MPESWQIRGVREAEADAVVELWDRMVRQIPDGGPLTATGRRHLARMVATAAWHRQTFCLVAVRGDEVLGLSRLGPGDGLLPGAVGEVQELYVRPGLPKAGELRSRLAEAVISRLRELGAAPLRKLVAADDPGEQRFWAGQRFTADMVVMSSYDNS